jgi:hypothetical protein
MVKLGIKMVKAIKLTSNLKLYDIND